MDKETFHIDKEQFVQLHRTIQGYVIFEMLTQASGSSKDLEAIHVRQVQALMDSQCGRTVMLPYQLRAERTYTGVCLYKNSVNCVAQKTEQAIGFPEIVLSVEEQNALLAGKELVFLVGAHQKMRVKIIHVEKNGIDFENIPQNKYTKWFDYGKIKNSIVIRTRRPGDYLTVNSMNQHKTLKSYFVDHKVPQKERNQICLLADDRHIIWIVGERISNYYKVSEHTKTILCVVFEEDS